MISLLSLVIGALAPSLPSIITILQNWFQTKGQIELIKIQGELKMEQSKFDAMVASAQAALAEANSLRDHDKALIGQSWFFDAMRSSIRPVVTYLFILLFFGIKFLFIYQMVNTIGVDWITASRAVLDSDTTEIFSSIICFWFGSRTSPFAFKTAPAK